MKLVFICSNQKDVHLIENFKELMKLYAQIWQLHGMSNPCHLLSSNIDSKIKVSLPCFMGLQ